MRRAVWVIVLGLALGVVVQASSSGGGPQARELHRLRAALSWQRHERRTLERRLAEKWELATPTLRDAAFIAARVYPRVDPWALLRVSACETRGSFDPEARANHAQNASSKALGPAQFLPSTWRSTPFARWSPANAYVAMLAMAQIVDREGFAAWDCRWAA